MCIRGIGVALPTGSDCAQGINVDSESDRRGDEEAVDNTAWTDAIQRSLQASAFCGVIGEDGQAISAVSAMSHGPDVVFKLASSLVLGPAPVWRLRGEGHRRLRRADKDRRHGGFDFRHNTPDGVCPGSGS